MSILGSFGSKNYENSTEQSKPLPSSGPLLTSSQNNIQNSTEDQLNNFKDSIYQSLTSPNEIDRIRGIKMLILGVAKGYDFHEFAPLVVQQLISNDLNCRQLAYIYLTHFAFDCYDTILLSINSFQKALADSDPSVRVLALKMISSVPQIEIIPEIQKAIDQVIGDTNPYVKKEVSYALIKASELDPNLIEGFLPYIQRLMLEKDPITFSGAIAAYWSLCPENIEFIHPNFRYIVNNIRNLDEYGQIYTIRSLTVYTRLCFKNPASTSNDDSAFSEEAFWEENNDSLNTHKEPLSADHLLIISAVKKLLNSLNAGVVISAILYFYYCSPVNHLKVVARPLVRLLYDKSPSIIGFALQTILSVAKKDPLIFIPHLNHFFIHKNDSAIVKKMKLKVLSSLASPSNADIILGELSKYTGSNDSTFSALSIKTIGDTAIEHPNIIPSAFTALLRLMGRVSFSDTIVLSEIVFAISKLLKLKRGTEDEEKALHHLCRKFVVICDPYARASVLAVVGDTYLTHRKYAPQMLRYVAQHFDEESPEVKLQALNLAAKLITIQKDEPSKETESQLPLYLMKLCARDGSFDVSDRAKFLIALVETNNEKLKQNLRSILFPSTSSQQEPQDNDKKVDSPLLLENDYQLGTFSSLFNREISGYEPLTDWAPENELPDSSVRIPVKRLPDGTLVPEEKEEKRKRAKNIDEDDVEQFLGDEYYEIEEEEEEEEDINDVAQRNKITDNNSNTVNNNAPVNDANEVVEYYEYEEEDEKESFFD